MKRSSLLLVLFILSGVSLCSAKAPDPITIKSEIDKPIATIGDKITYSIVITKDKDIEVAPIELPKDIGNFALKDFGSKQQSFFGRQTLRQWYLLDTYITGKSAIPEITVKYRKSGEKGWKELKLEKREIEIKSLLNAPGGKLSLRDIKAPVSLASPWKWFFIGLTFLLGALIGFFVWRLIRDKAKEEASFVRQAHEIALEQLEGLRQKDYIAKGMIKEYYIEISDIVRHYLENRFDLKAPEMTTEEFLQHVHSAFGLASGHRELLKEFLTCCDLVKFAKYAPTVEEINAVYTSAWNFVEQTKQPEEVNSA